MIDNNNNKQNDSDIQITQENGNTSKEEELLKSSCEVHDVIDPKDNQIMQLEIKLAQLQTNERDTVLRLTAEIENVRRRSVQEIEKAHKFALERLMFELLPVIDNLERTLNIVDRSNVSFSAIVEGIELTLKSFLDTVFKFGLTPVNEINVSFNPEVHQAISTVESTDCVPNQVLTMIQKGYLLNGRLIRPAMVTVSKLKGEKDVL